MDETYDDPLSQAVLLTDPKGPGAEHWTLDDSPDPDTAMSRMRDFARTNAIAGRSYDDVAAGFARRFKDVAPPSAEEYQAWQDRAPLEHQLDVERHKAMKEGTAQQNWALRKAVSFPRDIAVAAIHNVSKNRFDEGVADQGDLRNLALAEVEHQVDAKKAATWSGWGAGTALSLPSHAAGMMLGGQIAGKAAPALGLAGDGAAAGVGRLALQTATTPGMYLQHAIENNTAEGRDALDVTGLASGYGLGLAQMATLQVLGGLTDKLMPTTSIAGRAAVQGLAGPVAQQVTDVITSGLGLSTDYGTLGAIAEGKYGDALKHVLGDAATFAAFSLMHGAPTENGTNGARTVSGPSAEAGGGARGIPPRGPAGGPAESPAGLPPKGKPPVFEAFVEALNHLGRGYNGRPGYSPQAAGGVLKGLVGQLHTALRKNPNLTRAEAADLFKSYDDGPVKRFVMTLVDALPERPAAPPQNAQNRSGRARPPAAPKPAEPPVRPAEPTPAAGEPAAAEEPNLFSGAPEPAAAAPAEPAKPAEPTRAERRAPARVSIGPTEVLKRGGKMDPAEARAVDKFGEGNVVRVDLVRGGKKVGHATLAEEGDSVHVAWLGAEGMAGGEGRANHPFGEREILSLAHDLARSMPDVKWVKYTASEGRIRAGEARMIDLEKLRRREKGADQPAPPAAAEPVAEPPIAAEAPAAPKSESIDAPTARERLLAGDDVGMDVLQKLGLSRDEAHVIRERALKKRGFAEIGKDKTTLLREVRKARVQQIEVAARKKLGIEGSIEDLVIGREKAGNKEALREEGLVVDGVREVGPPARQPKRSADEIRAEKLDRLAERMLAAQKRAGGGPLSPGERKFFDDEAARIVGAKPPKKAGGLVGHETMVVTPAGQVPARYEVRDLATVKASHQVTPLGAFRDRSAAGEYPKNLQPRDYNVPGERRKVLDYAKDLNPDILITNHPAAAEGPPTITKDGTVLNGNGRQMVLERSAHVGTYPKYKDALLREAERYGINAAEVEVMERPALYRVVDLDPTSSEASRFAKAGNVSMTQSQAPARTAASLGGLVDDAVIDSLRLEGDTTFSEAVTDPLKGKAFRDRLRGELPPQEVGRYFHDDGRLTEAGVEFVRNILLTKIIPVDLVEKMGERMKAVKRTIEGAIPQFVKLKRDYPTSDPTEQLVEGLGVFVRNPDMRTLSDADNVLAQGSLFGGKAEILTPGGRMMLDLVLEAGMKPLVFRQRLTQFVQDLEQATNGLFREENPDVPGIAAAALKVPRRDGAVFGALKELADVIAAGKNAGVPGDAVRASVGQIQAEAREAAQAGGGQAAADSAAAAGAAANGSVEPPPEDLASAIGRPAAQQVVDWLKDETATWSIAGNSAALAETAEKMGRAFTYIGDSLGRLSGQMAPATTRLDPRAGEALVRYAASREYGKLMVEHLVDQVLGLHAGDVVDQVAGAVLTEMRLQFMKAAYRAKGMNDEADAVTTLVGAADSPLTDQARFVALRNSPRMQEIIARWKNYVVPVAEAAFKKALGMADTDPISTFTQIPGMPITLKGLKGDDKGKFPAFTGRGKQGNLSNPRARKLKHTEQATGTAEAYEQSLAAIIGNMIEPRIENATKAEMYRELERAGLLKWTREGQGAEFDGRAGRELPNVRPPRGTQANLPMQTSAYVHPEAYGEVRKALAVDEPGDWVPIMRAITAIPTVATLASFVEVATHAINLSGGLFGPKMNLYKLAVNVQQRVWDKRAFRVKLLPLAKEGAVKPHGVAGGTVVNQINQILGVVGAKLPEGAKYFDPTMYFGESLKVLDDALRVTAAEAYDQIAAAGHAPATATGKRDFLNQTFGQYNAKMQHALVALARWTGIGPFATAGTTMTARSIRIVFGGGSGIKPLSWKSSARLRGETYTRLLGLLASGAVLNFLAWGRWDGDDSTPVGSIKVGEADGKTKYVDTPASLILRRGLRSVGALALLEGQREGHPAGVVVDRGVKETIRSIGHPFMGPAFQLAYEAFTGEDLIGRPIAPKVTTATTERGIEKAVEKGRLRPGSSQVWSNVKGAIGHANPVYSAVTDADEIDPAKKGGFWDRFNKLLGPVGVKSRKHRVEK